MRWAVVFLLSGFVSAGMGARAGAEPASTAPAPITEHEYRRALLDYNQRTLPQAYQKVGKHNPKWDKDALAFLQAMALRFTNAGADDLYSLPGEKPGDELLAMGKSLRDKGCDDPMVTYCYAALLHDSNRDAEAAPLFHQSDAVLMDSHYPLTRAMNAAAREFQMAEGDKARQDAWKRFRDVAVTTMSTWDFKNLDRRIIYNDLIEFLEGAGTARLEDLVDSAHANPAVDPWIRDVLEGQTEIDAAWDSRGNGWANSVTQQGWQGFYAHLFKARTALRDAWRRHPDYPEPAALMITVGMGAGAEFNEAPRKWYDRAVGAQIDYFPAYVAYRNAILPRWGGSISQLQSFARESLATHRFDTLVPWQYVVTIETIVGDSGNPGYWKAPGIYEGAVQACEGYIKSMPQGRERRFYQGFEAAVSWRVGKFDRAVALLNSFGDHPPIGAFRRFRVMPKLAISHAYAMADTDSAKAIETGEQQASSDQLDQAVATYTGAVQAAGDARSAHYLKCRLQQLQWRAQFEKGDWVDIKPTTDELVGWGAESGTWSVDPDGTLVARPNGTGPMLTFQGIFMAPRYEVEMTFQFPKSEQPSSAGFSLVPNDPGIFRGWSVVKTPDGATLKCGWAGPEWNRAMNANKGDNTLLLRYWDDKVKADFDDQSYPRLREMDRVLTGPKVYLAIGGMVPSGKELRISKIRLRKLAQEPPKE